MIFTVLGSGTSFGVPVIGCDCNVCSSKDPRDRRTRVAALIEGDEGRVLIDTPPEVRLQLVAAKVPTLDAVLYTHEHADHVHGIDDLRAISGRRGHLDVFGPAHTLSELAARFPYIFDESMNPPKGSTKPHLVPHPVEAGTPFTVAGLSILPVEVLHGAMHVHGYRVGDLGYLTDVKSIPDATREHLKGVRVLVLSALLDRPHPTHLSIDEAVTLASEIGAEQTYLTHLTHRHAYAELAERLPTGVEPAYDGLRIPF